MAASQRSAADSIVGKITSHSNPFMTLTAVNESQVEIEPDYVGERN